MSQAPTSNARQLVVFPPAGEEYALPIAAVHEIIRYAEPRSVVSETGRLRGRIVPVYALAARLGVPAGEIVIVETDAGQIGVVVDDVEEEVLTLAADQMEAVSSARLRAIDAMARAGDRPIVLLEPEGLFAGDPADELAAA